jgi:hypothetical protein
LIVVLGPLNGKPKEKKEPIRQSTLFGLPLGKPIQKPEKRGQKKKITEDNNQSQTTEEGWTSTASIAVSVPQSSMQSSDVTMVEAEREMKPSSEATLVETQQVDEPHETQGESQDMQADTNPGVRVCVECIIDALANSYKQESEELQDGVHGVCCSHTVSLVKRS